MSPKRSAPPSRYIARHARKRRPLIRALLIICAALVLLFGYMLLEAKMLRIERTTIVSSALSRDVGQLRIVYLSDIHRGTWPYLTQSDMEGLVSTINAQNPDLVLLGGDYAQKSDDAIEFFKHLPTIRASYGVYGVMGNHDRTLPESNLSILRSSMIMAGVTPIVNETVKVRVGMQDITLAGIDDTSNGWPDITGVAAQCRQSDLVVFLSHSPAAIPPALNAVDMDGRKNWFDLGLFGHTHGGQIALIGSLLFGHEEDSLYNSGWYAPSRSTSLLVSNGAGTVGYPFRLGVPPQLHVITIKSE